MANVQGDVKENSTPIGFQKLKIPTGYRFCPTPAELILHYLKNKILGQPLPADVITTVDVYSSRPDKLPLDDFKHGKENEWYFFSTASNDNGTILTEKGYYRTIIDNYNIRDKDGNIVGSVRVRVFYDEKTSSETENTPGEANSRWIIFEFRVNPELLVISKDDHSTREKAFNFVACKIKKHKTEENLQSQQAQ